MRKKYLNKVILDLVMEFRVLNFKIMLTKTKLKTQHSK